MDAAVKRYWRGSIDNPLEPDFNKRVINNAISRYYSLSEVVKFKKIHEYANNFKYEWVVACRTDLILNSKVKLSTYNPNYVNFSKNQKQPKNMINDWFNFGSSAAMDCYMNIFGLLDHLLSQSYSKNRGAWAPEILHKIILDKFNIPSKGHQIDISLPRF